MSTVSSTKPAESGWPSSRLWTPTAQGFLGRCSTGYLDRLWSELVPEADPAHQSCQKLKMREKAILPVFGHLRPDQITTDDWRAYIARRREAGRSEWTIHTEMGHLRIVVKWAEDTGRIDRRRRSSGTRCRRQ